MQESIAGSHELKGLGKRFFDLTKIHYSLSRMLLDTESETLVPDAFTRPITYRTSFVIVHRFSTVLNADKILVLNDGRLVEAGAHSKLIQRGAHKVTCSTNNSLL